MSIPKEIQPLIGRPYDILSFPRNDLPEEKYSYDCRLLWQEYYRQRFKITLPVGMWSQEAFTDKQILRFVQPYERPVEGDIYFFSQPDYQPKQFHLATFTGTWQDNQPVLIHASAFNGRKVKLETLTQILQTPQYPILQAVKRLQQGLFEAHILPVVYNNFK